VEDNGALVIEIVADIAPNAELLLRNESLMTVRNACELSYTRDRVSAAFHRMQELLQRAVNWKLPLVTPAGGSKRALASLPNFCSFLELAEFTEGPLLLETDISALITRIIEAATASTSRVRVVTTARIMSVEQVGDIVMEPVGSDDSQKLQELFGDLHDKFHNELNVAARLNERNCGVLVPLFSPEVALRGQGKQRVDADLRDFRGYCEIAISSERALERFGVATTSGIAGPATLSKSVLGMDDVRVSCSAGITVAGLHVPMLGCSVVDILLPQSQGVALWIGVDVEKLREAFNSQIFNDYTSAASTFMGANSTQQRQSSRRRASWAAGTAGAKAQEFQKIDLFLRQDEHLKRKIAFRSFLDWLSACTNVGGVLRLFTNLRVAYDISWQFPGNAVVSRPGTAYIVATCCSRAARLNWHYQSAPAIARVYADILSPILGDVERAHQLAALCPFYSESSGFLSFSSIPIACFQERRSTDRPGVSFELDLEFLCETKTVQSQSSVSACSSCHRIVGRFEASSPRGTTVCAHCALSNVADFQRPRRSSDVQLRLIAEVVKRHFVEHKPCYSFSDICWLCGRHGAIEGVHIHKVALPEKESAVHACSDCEEAFKAMLDKFRSPDVPLHAFVLPGWLPVRRAAEFAQSLSLRRERTPAEWMEMQKWLKLESEKWGGRLEWKESTIPNAGRGLFARSSADGCLRVAFAAHEIIGAFYGKLHAHAEANPDTFFDRAVTVPETAFFINCDLYNLASMVNDATAVCIHGRELKVNLNNARICVAPCEDLAANIGQFRTIHELRTFLGIFPALLVLVAERTIMTGEEIFTDYGHEFREMMPQVPSDDDVMEISTPAVVYDSDVECTQPDAETEDATFRPAASSASESTSVRDFLPRPCKRCPQRATLALLSQYLTN
jgi:hypothetical protein